MQFSSLNPLRTPNVSKCETDSRNCALEVHDVFQSAIVVCFFEKQFIHVRGTYCFHAITDYLG